MAPGRKRTGLSGLRYLNRSGSGGTGVVMETPFLVPPYHSPGLEGELVAKPSIFVSLNIWR